MAAILLVTIWLHTWDLIEDSRSLDLTRAEVDIANLARLSQEHAERKFHNADHTLRMVLMQVHEHQGQVDLQRMSALGLFDSHILLQVSVLDAQGLLRHSSLPYSGRIDLSP